MRPCRLATTVVLALAGSGVGAQAPGLKAPAESPWPRWQARFETLGPPTLQGFAATTDPAAAAAGPGARLFGDVYLFDLRTSGGDYAGGLRATSGLTVGARGLATGMPPGVGGSGLAWRDRGPLDGSEAVTASLPYLGIGVTGLSLKGGWGVSADLGLAGYGSATGLRPGRSGADLNAAEEVLRELRLTPVLQLGVSYSF